MSRKKGVSFDEKRSRLLSIFYEQKAVFNLKELEKHGTKAGIVTQTVKDVLQTLVDDGIVDFDKIGSQNFFWAFPSKALLKREIQQTAYAKEIETLNQRHAELARELEELLASRQETDERRVLLDEHASLQAEAARLDSELQLHKDNDPETIRELEEKVKVCMDSANRWTDNAWTLKTYIVKKHGRSAKEVDTMMGLPPDFDYVA